MFTWAVFVCVSVNLHFVHCLHDSFVHLTQNWNFEIWKETLDCIQKNTPISKLHPWSFINNKNWGFATHILLYLWVVIKDMQLKPIEFTNPFMFSLCSWILNHDVATTLHITYLFPFHNLIMESIMWKSFFHEFMFFHTHVVHLKYVWSTYIY